MQSLLPVRPLNAWRIYNPLGVWVGNIDTLLLDTTTGFARFAWTTFFNIPLRQLALPWRALSFSHDHSAFLTLLTDERLKTAPEITTSLRANDVERTLLDHFELTSSSQSRAPDISPAGIVNGHDTSTE